MLTGLSDDPKGISDSRKTAVVNDELKRLHMDIATLQETRLPSCLGQFGIGKMIDNGQRLLELCTYHNLCIANSFFKTKPQHKVSWRHPRSKHWHQLDLILVRRTAIKNVLLTCSYHSADCDTDHSLVCCKIKLQPKRYHRGKKQGYPRIDVSKMSQPDLVEQFARKFESELKTSQTGDSDMEKWATLRDAIHRTALAIFGRKTLKSHDWFEAKMTPIIEAKHASLAEYKRSPSERNLQILRAARSKAQHTARHCANEYWSELSETIQTAAITGNIRGMYNGIRTAMGPAQNKTAPLKSTTGEVITDKGQQMERWVEHYSDLYSRQNVVTTAALDAIECLPAIEELDIELTIEELNKAINSLASGKAPGSDGIPPDLMKHCATTLLLPLHEVLCQAGKKGLFLKTWGTPRSSPSTKTKANAATVTTTEASHYSASWARSSLGSSWSVCRNLLNTSTQSHSVVSELKDQR